MTSRLSCCRWVLLGLTLLALPAGGTQIIRRTLPELTEGADLIFAGRCEAVSCHWNADRSLILTAYRFRVTRALKGEAGETITLQELGGTVGAVSMDVPGTPRYVVREEVVLFVRRTELGRWVTMGAEQGKFRLSRDSQGRPQVESDFYPAELTAMTRGERVRGGVPLAVFAARVRAAAREGGARR